MFTEIQYKEEIIKEKKEVKIEDKNFIIICNREKVNEEKNEKNK